jgi:hypothetical protein
MFNFDMDGFKDGMRIFKDKMQHIMLCPPDVDDIERELKLKLMETNLIIRYADFGSLEAPNLAYLNSRHYFISVRGLISISLTIILSAFSKQGNGFSCIFRK